MLTGYTFEILPFSTNSEMKLTVLISVRTVELLQTILTNNS